MDIVAINPIIALLLGALLFILTLRIVGTLLQNSAQTSEDDTDDAPPELPFRFMVREVETTDDGRVVVFGLMAEGKAHAGNRAVIVRADGMQIDTRVLAIGVERGWMRLLLDDVRQDELMPGDVIYNAAQFV
jgi:hypothetical protein